MTKYKKPKYSLGGWIKDNKQGVIGGVKTLGGAALALGSFGALAPVGAGLMTSGISDIGQEISGDIDANNQAELQEQQQRSMRQQNLINSSPRSFANNQSVFAFGGDMSNKLTEYFGAKHEQGGIDIGRAEVEGGETRGFNGLKDYIFSDRLKFGDRTFAAKSKEIESKYPFTNDIIDIKGKERDLSNLAYAQELTREKIGLREQARNNKKMMFGGSFLPPLIDDTSWDKTWGYDASSNPIKAGYIGWEGSGDPAEVSTKPASELSDPETNPFLTAGLSAIPNLTAAFLAQGQRENINYPKVGTYEVSPQLVNDNRAVQDTKGAFADSNNLLRSMGLSRGNFLSNRLASATKQGQQVSDVRAKYANMNADIMNKSNMFNAQQAAASSARNAGIAQQQTQDRVGISQNAIALGAAGLNTAFKNFSSTSNENKYLALAGGENKSLMKFGNKLVVVTERDGVRSVEIDGKTYKLTES